MPLANFGPLEAILFVGGILIILVWLRGSPRPPLRVNLFLTIFAISPILPGAASLAVQVIALGMGFLEWTFGNRKAKRGSLIATIVALIVVYWAMLIFHPNVPGLSAGAQGYQKSVLALSGIMLGMAIHSRHQKGVELLIIKLITASLAVSIIAHFWLPSLVRIVNREADTYTATFGGVSRLQGIYPGPFHVALASLVLLTWCIYRWSSHRYISIIAIVVGLAALYFSYVRTAYVALALVLLAALLLSKSIAGKVKVTASLLTISVPMALLFRSGATTIFDVAASISGFANDGRFIGRISGYETGLELFSQSPFYGWGTGAAGDTLGDEFAGSEHISPHNVALKILVEGGLVGLILWILFIGFALSRLDRRHPGGKLAICLFVAIFALGLTTASIEALPPSYFIFVLVGLAISERRIYGRRVRNRYWQHGQGVTPETAKAI